MKKTVAIVLFAVSALSAWAQVAGVSVDLRFEQDQFISSEEVRLGVRVTNLSGRPLELGKEKDWVQLHVQSVDQFIVPKLEEMPVTGEFRLESTQAGTRWFNITPFYDFRRPGRYRVTATVRIPGAENAVMSAPRNFDVVGGTKLREFAVGVPSAVAGEPPEARKYILQQANYLNQMRLYVRITDESGVKTLKLLPVAQMISFSEPEAQVDGQSRLHILHQTGARTFNYSVILPDGTTSVRQTHEYTATRPVLRLSGGIVAVLHGARRYAATDIPASTVEGNVVAKP